MKATKRNTQNNLQVINTEQFTYVNIFTAFKTGKYKYI